MNNNDDIKKTTSPPTSGDGIYIDGKIPKSFCSLGILVNGLGEDKNLYATTCFHGLYNGEKLVDDGGNKLEFGERFDKRKKECEDQNSKTYSTSYCFRSKPYKKCTDETSEKGSSLGKFYAGIYDEKHDLGIVKVDKSVTCNGTIPETVEYDHLTEKCYIGKKIKENRSQQKSLSVFKTGFKTGLTTGMLDYGYTKKNSKNKVLFKQAYRVDVAEVTFMPAFMEEGDSGSLVMWKDEYDNKWPFAYCVGSISSIVGEALPHEREYVCFSLIDSLRECNNKNSI